MNEALLHHIWKYKLLMPTHFKTNKNESIEIIKSGEHNHHAGPDFSNARIKIGDTLWAGNIEIHIKTSDWIKHKHDGDAKYKNVILHVVYEHDLDIAGHDAIPVLELKDHISKLTIDKYKNLVTSKTKIPCSSAIKNLESNTYSIWLERMTIERLEQKSEEILNQLELLKNDWNELCFQTLATVMGFKINNEGFKQLSKSISIYTLLKHQSQIAHLEALLFGQAGFLREAYSDKYIHKLQNEYIYLSKKYNIKPIDVKIWNFLRLRPSNFPTIRIAELAAIISKGSISLDAWLACKSVNELKDLLSVSLDGFWDKHYTLKEESDFKKKKLGEDSQELIIINAIIPLLFIYGKAQKNQSICDKAIQFLTQLKAEKNTITKGWDNLNLNAANAAESQGQIQLFNNYCKTLNCLNCGIGAKLVS